MFWALAWRFGILLFLGWESEYLGWKGRVIFQIECMIREALYLDEGRKREISTEK
jgi:hypothetical protein